MQNLRLRRLKKCLIVDDDTDYLETLQQLLQHFGLQCDIAEDGAKAWTVIESSPPDLLITDMRMPSLDGIELLTRCRRAGFRFYTVLVSGCSQTLSQPRPEADASLHDCCATTLVKPFNMQSMLACLREADAHEHAHSELA